MADGHEKQNALNRALGAFHDAAQIKWMCDEVTREGDQPNDKRGREGLDAFFGWGLVAL